jgi:hypothetical protein
MLTFHRFRQKIVHGVLYIQLEIYETAVCPNWIYALTYKNT